MPKKYKHQRSWLRIKPQSSFGSESGRSSTNSYLRKSRALSDYTYTEPEFSNSNTHKNLNLNLLISNLSYFINFPGTNNKNFIKVNQKSLFKIYQLNQKPWNTIFDLLKINFLNNDKNNINTSNDNNNNIKREKSLKDITMYNKLLKGFVNFVHIKITNKLNEIDITKNSLLEIIQKINTANFEIGEFLDVTITNEKNKTNTPFHKLLSQKSITLKLKNHTFKKNKSSKRHKKLTYDKYDMDNILEAENEVIFDEKNIEENEKKIEEQLQKKEKKKKKKKKEDFPFESKNEHSSQSAVNVPLTNNIIPKSNVTTNSINIDKSLISQEDLDDLRKDFFEKPITIRRIIYKVIKKKKKIKSMI